MIINVFKNKIFLLYHEDKDEDDQDEDEDY